MLGFGPNAQKIPTIVSLKTLGIRDTLAPFARDGPGIRTTFLEGHKIVVCKRQLERFGVGAKSHFTNYGCDVDSLVPASTKTRGGHGHGYSY